MSESDYSVVIVGGGMVGLSLACALAPLNLRIAVIEKHAPEVPNDLDTDTRMSSLNFQSQRFLQALGVWEKLPVQALCPLREMQVWDSLGGGSIHFDAADLGVAELGFIVENRALRYALWQSLKACTQVDVVTAAAEEVLVDTKGATLMLNNQVRVRADLLIVADGGRSCVRERLCMPIQTIDCHQQAIVGVVQTEKPHGFTAYQHFLSTGPVAVLPLADHHRMNVIWSADNEVADRLMALEKSAFERELSTHFQSQLGKMTVLTDRKAIPLIMRHAKQYVQAHVALVGDAAHTIHPLAGQGVNLGFSDSAELAKTLSQALRNQRHIGSLRVLRQYERARKGDNAAMLLAMRLFKDVFASQRMPVVQIRSLGFNAVNRLSFLKKFFMEKASGFVD